MTTATLATVNTAEACRLTGLTPRQVLYWTRLGALVPHDTGANPGTGNPHAWTDAELRIMRLLAAAAPMVPQQLGSLGRVQILAEIARLARANPQQRWALVDDVTVRLESDPLAVLDAMSTRSTLAVPLS